MNSCPHHDRPNVLSLPSHGNPHCCQECFDARMANYTPYKGKREAWEYASDYHFDGKTVTYDSTRGRVETYSFGPNERFK